jgi:hypothetical protein
MITKIPLIRLIGLLLGTAAALTIAQAASAIGLLKPPPPPPAEIYYYYSFHLTNVYLNAPAYAEVVFATTTPPSMTTTLTAANIVGIAVGSTGPTPSLPGMPTFGPYPLANLQLAQSLGYPESASVSVVGGVATLNSLELFLDDATQSQLVQLDGGLGGAGRLIFYAVDLVLSGDVVPKSQWTAFVPPGASVDLTNPPSGEFSQ